jgi:hypothetical protein
VSCDCKIVPYSSRHLPDIIEIHGRETLLTERATKEYETYLNLPKTATLLAMRDGKASAYAVMGKGEDLRNCMHEWGGNPQDLLCLARELADSLEKGEIMILAPKRQNEFTRLLTQMKTQHKSDYLAMIRVIDVDGVSSVVRDHVSDRLGQDFQIFRDRSGIKVRVGREEAPLDAERNLPRLLFGPDLPSSLLRGFSRETLSAFDTALPIPFFIWGLDSV